VCAPSAPMRLDPRLYAHVRETIQHMCVARDARSHTHNRECGHIHKCMPTYQIQTRVHALRLHSSAQHNSTYHTQTCPTTTHSCEQAMYCTHMSVWSVELSASAAAMCCAPSAPMRLSSRLYAHVCVRRIQRTCVAHDTRFHTHNRECEIMHEHADCKKYLSST
jgi:hypothetical protein